MAYFNMQLLELIKTHILGFLGGAVVESPPADAGDAGSCPGPGRSHMPRVRSPVWEDATCRGAAGPVSHGR